MNYNLLCILGPTASGKTSLAANIASRLNGEIISADSRQVYRGMDIGTGKDYDDYIVNGRRIPVHLVDIADAGTEYNVFRYQEDFVNSFREVTGRGCLPILCGGTGMYLQAVLSGYSLVRVPENPVLRSELESMPEEILVNRLKSYRDLHNITDITERSRLIRAIEIEEYRKIHPGGKAGFPELRPLVTGIMIPRELRRNRITLRLDERLRSGMTEEVSRLLDSGIDPGRLIKYGLEYKYITLWLTGNISYDEMRDQLNTAIHQFAKRQMTWFRKMEKEGIGIRWINGTRDVNEMADQIIGMMNQGE